ncbi:TadE/TadG family type IV pilus assembly protein [Bradyrhizobium sp. AZCC 2289]|uniref:TadE/TadG family type IV pilus assembly protein n=1 Tax=Bradyrhizobium sp. AZCC 2289 TaxID=3117026 RepID=UPI002FEEE914
MKVANKIWRDERGATALEFAILAPVFFLLIFGIIAFGLLCWTQVGLQHGAEMAARCASINTTLCPNDNSTAITNYARQQAFGLSLPASTFTYPTPRPPCGNQVRATYTVVFPNILNLSPLMLTAQACFPA